MTHNPWLAFFRRTAGRPPQPAPARRRPPFRPRLESLESRTVLNGGGVVNGVSQTDFGSIVPIVQVTGAVSLSVDGVGTVAEAGTVRVAKPAGATVRAAYLASASAGKTDYKIGDGVVTIDGAGVAWDVVTPSSIFSWNHWADVTALVKSKLDAAAAGTVTFTIGEGDNTFLIDGSILAVLFDDPSQTTDNTVALLFGAQAVGGDTFNVAFAAPLDKSIPGLALEMSLGISYSFRPSDPPQYSLVNVNGERLTTSAGGFDDGAAFDGALLTVGGIGDGNGNPLDPFALDAGNRYDDELYNLLPFVPNGATTVSVYTENPSQDDNIFFAAFSLKGTTAVVGEGVVLGPVEANHDVGTSATVTATLQNTQGQPIAGREVTFQVVSGPQTGTTGVAITGDDGKATFTYTGLAAGNDQVQASFVNSQNQTVLSNVVVRRWLQGNRPPSVGVGGPYTVTEGGSVTLTALGQDLDGDVITFAWDLDNDGLFETTGQSVTFSAASLDGPTSWTVQVRGEDGQGGSAVSAGVVNVVNVAPTAAITGAPASGTPGTAITLGSTVTDPGAADTHTFAWAVTKDGGAYASGSGSSFSFTPDGGGTYEVYLTVTDDDGGVGTAFGSILVGNVENVAPTAGITGPTSGVRGQPRAFLLTASDPSAADQAAGFVYSINWGDGSPVQTVARTPNNGSGVSLDHVFTQSGTYTVQVTATDIGGASTTATHTITIGAVGLQPDPCDPTLTALVVGGTAGKDSIVLDPGGAAGAVKVVLNGVTLGTFSPTGRVLVYAQAGDDTIQVAGGVSLPAWLFGGAGDDQIHGGGGESLIVGGDGDDQLQSGQGRDLLIGGRGKDQLQGNAGDDLLIAGTTAFDGDLAALCAIMDEWTSGRNYATRVANLLGTGTGPRDNGDYFLRASGSGVTVFDDTSVDQLQGASGLDWYFANLVGGVRDEVSGQSSSEILVELTVVAP